MPTFFAKTNEPVRLFYDIPDHTTDKGVKVLIFAEGSTAIHEDDSSLLLSTVNLVHRTAGRYSALYSPPDNRGERLTVKFVVYTDDTYGTKDTGYWAGSQQIVLNSGVGQLGGGGRAVVRDEQLSRIADLTADKVWEKDLTGLKDNNTAAVWLKSRADQDDIVASSQFIKSEMGKIDIGAKSLARGLSAVLNGMEKNVKEHTKKIVDLATKKGSNNLQQIKDTLNNIKAGLKSLKLEEKAIRAIKDLIDQQKASSGEIKGLIGGLESKRFKNIELDMKIDEIRKISKNISIQEGLTQSTLLALKRDNVKNKKELVKLIRGIK